MDKKRMKRMIGIAIPMALIITGISYEQYEQAKAAVKSMGLDVEVEYITDLQKVVGYGAMSMPALVVNEKVVAMGKVLKAADVEKLLHKLGF